MRNLKQNERLIKEYDKFLLIEVKCPHGKSYKTTIDKFIPRDLNHAPKQNKSTYRYLGYVTRGFYHEF